MTTESLDRSGGAAVDKVVRFESTDIGEYETKIVLCVDSRFEDEFFPMLAKLANNFNKYAKEYFEASVPECFDDGFDAGSAGCQGCEYADNCENWR